MFEELPYKEAVAAFRHHYLDSLAKRCEGNVSKMSVIAGYNRTTLYALFLKHSVDPHSYGGRRGRSNSFSTEEPTSLVV